MTFNILKLLPFTYASRQIGIVVRKDDGESWFFMKGAHMVMTKLVANDWMDEEFAGHWEKSGRRTVERI